MADLLTTAEAARQLGVHPNTVYNWTERGILQAATETAGGHARYHAAVVERLRARLVRLRARVRNGKVRARAVHVLSGRATA